MANRSKPVEPRPPAVGLIYIDNYEELINTRDMPVVSQVLACMQDFFGENNGVMVRNEPGRFFFLLEQNDLSRVLSKKFALLDRVREIPTASGMPITVSIAVGIGKTLPEAFDSARQAMELSQGRGGDQAVIKQERNFRFYGGKRQPGERYSRVKSRVVAHALGQLMRSLDSVVVMGHRMADYDSIGAALGVAACASAMGKKASIVIEAKNDMIAGILADAAEQEPYDNMFLTPEEALEQVGADTLLIIVDTQFAASTPAPQLLEQAGAIAVIDHHRRGIASIEQAALQFVQVYASSTCELVCEILQYFKPDVTLTPLLSSALLSGITVDTKHFSLNTGVRTFEAAAYLRKHGANAVFVKELFQDDTQHYLDRADVVRRAEYVRPEVVISVCQATSSATLIAAQAADILTGMRGIHAAFVLAPTERGINVSARSSGEVNVQMILEQLGGGGHMHVAGAQFPPQPVEALIKRLIKAIDQYFDESA